MSKYTVKLFKRNNDGMVIEGYYKVVDKIDYDMTNNCYTFYTGNESFERPSYEVAAITPIIEATSKSELDMIAPDAHKQRDDDGTLSTPDLFQKLLKKGDIVEISINRTTIKHFILKNDGWLLAGISGVGNNE